MLLGLFLLFLFEDLKVLLALLHGRLGDEIEWSWHLLRNLGALDLAHGLAHLLLVGVGDAHDLVCRWNLALRDLVAVLDVVLQLQIALVHAAHILNLTLFVYHFIIFIITN